MGAAKARGEAESKLGEIKVDTEKIVAEARKEAETKAKEIIIEARDEAQQLVKNADKENRKKQSDFDKLQNRLNQKEESLDKKLEQIEKKEEDIKDREKKISASEQEIEKKLQEQREKLQQISGLSAEEARAHLLGILDKDLKKEYANAIKDYGDKLKIEAKRRSQQIISMAIQRCAVDHVAESTVSVVPLSSDDMKGRIIGREGRNIRSFETLTGVDLVVDDTPEAVVISSFDPIRSRRSLAALLKSWWRMAAFIRRASKKSLKKLAPTLSQTSFRKAKGSLSRPR